MTDTRYKVANPLAVQLGFHAPSSPLRCTVTPYQVRDGTNPADNAAASAGRTTDPTVSLPSLSPVRLRAVGFCFEGTRGELFGRSAAGGTRPGQGPTEVLYRWNLNLIAACDAHLYNAVSYASLAFFRGSTAVSNSEHVPRAYVGRACNDVVSICLIGGLAYGLLKHAENPLMSYDSGTSYGRSFPEFRFRSL